MALKEFVITKPRPLPVILLADTSGSMEEDGKIEALNSAVKEMIQTFSVENRLRAEIQVCIVTFGGEAAIHTPLTPAHQYTNFESFKAYGSTPMGATFTIVKDLLEDKGQFPERSYQPIIILVSDGHPTDEWEGPFIELCSSERAASSPRFAMAIGNDANDTMLKEFMNDKEAPLFKGTARDIHRFFRAITMYTQGKSKNPDEPVQFYIPAPPEDDEVIEY